MKYDPNRTGSTDPDMIKCGWVSRPVRNEPHIMQEYAPFLKCPECGEYMHEGYSVINSPEEMERQKCLGRLEHPHKFEVGSCIFSWWCETWKCREVIKSKERHYMPKLTNKMQDDMNIPSSYRECSFDNFDGLQNTKNQLRSYTKIDNSQKSSLFLFGNSGAGKTHLAVAVINEHAKAGQRSQWFKKVPQLMLDLRNSFDSGESTENEIIESLKHKSFLVLDDLGVEKASEYAVTSLFIIISSRLEYNRPTIITSNLSLDAMSKTMPRIVSRLESYTIISFDDVPDYRREGK